MTSTGVSAATDGVRTLQSAPQFETGDARYASLNSVQAVGVGETPEPGVMRYAGDALA
jgi:hypothetical protein